MSEQRRSGDVRKEKTKIKGVKTGRLIAIAAIAILVAAFVSVAIYASSYEGIYPNLYVGDCDLSGKTPEEALVMLKETYDVKNVAGATIPLVCKNNRIELALDDLQIAFDHQASVDAAIEKSDYDNIFSKTFAMTARLLKRVDISPVLTYDKDKLEAAFQSVAGEFEIEPVGYTFQIEKDKVVLHGKVNGIKAEREPLIAQVEKQICGGDFGTIRLEPKSITPEPLDFDEFYKWLTSKPQNAYYEKGEDGKITVHPSKYQCEVDKETVQAALSAVDQSADNTTTFPVSTKEPELTTEMLTERLYKDNLGSYTTYYSGSAARNNNVRLASSRVNGTEMMPGDEFSYDKTILPRTWANGYQAAPVYVGNKVESGMGGGICQPSSTLYCAALYANLEILERHNHSMLVGYMPAGLDATIAEGYLDLRFKNNTGYPIKIVADSTGGKLTFSIFGYNPENISVELLRSGGGYHYSVTRVVKKNGQEISRQSLGSSRYSPKATEEPEPTESADPDATDDPNSTADPNATGEPNATTEPNAPEATAPAVTPVPTPTSSPMATPLPTTTVEPVVPDNLLTE